MATTSPRWYRNRNRYGIFDYVYLDFGYNFFCAKERMRIHSKPVIFRNVHVFRSSVKEYPWPTYMHCYLCSGFRDVSYVIANDRWCGKDTRLSGRTTLERKSGGPRTKKSQRKTRSLHRWTRSSVWSMDCLLWPISFLSVALLCTRGT